MALTISAEIKGLDQVINTLQAVLPDNYEQQRKVVGQALRAAVKSEALPVAKQFAMRGDGSGALSQSLGLRTAPKRQALAAGVTARIYMAPIRKDPKAVATYVNFYFVRQGIEPPEKLVLHGLQHGHLVEFGVPAHGIPARPYLAPAARVRFKAIGRQLAELTRKKAEAAIRRMARKKK